MKDGGGRRRKRRECRPPRVTHDVFFVLKIIILNPKIENREDDKGIPLFFQNFLVFFFKTNNLQN